MTLQDVIDGIERRQKTLTVFDPPSPAVVDEVAAFFTVHQVTVEEGSADGGPDGFAVLSDGITALAVVDLDDLTGRLRGTAESDAFADLFAHIDGLTFSTDDPAQLVATAREIEDRAWRSETGALHAGFRTLDDLLTQRTLYETLAATDLDVHLYARSERPGPDLPSVELHLSATDDPRETWFLVYDGGAVPSDKCALLTREHRPGQFSGVWTYDADVVDEVLTHLDEAYSHSG